MTDEKPKHKPQQKHTLSEVLRSLQDLIRADLIPAQEPPPPPRPAPAPDEPDSFENALDTLDHLITERIVEPAARAAPAPPEPLLPDETLEIDWGEPEDGAATDTADADDTPFEQLAPDTAIEPVFPGGAEPEPAVDLPEEQVELESIDLTALDDAVLELESPGLPAESTEFDLAKESGLLDSGGALDPAPFDLPEPLEPEADLEPESFESAAPDPAAGDRSNLREPAPPRIEPDGQHAFVFPEEPAPPDVAGFDVEPTEQVRASAETDAPNAASEPREAARSDHTVPPTDNRPARAAAASEQRENFADEPPAPAADSRFTVEYTVEPAAHTEAPERAVQPSRRMDATGRAASDRTVSREARPPERMSQDPKDTTPGREVRGARAHDTGTASEAGPRADGDEIPVLKEVADLRAPPAPPLPDAAQARDIAIRVIARLNIERRKAGEAPLDIKTIERLQQYLAEALLKRGLNKKPK
ncbi:MAG TPA: hypothetical protein VF203_08415 [Burkholderiales bacterium]